MTDLVVGDTGSKLLVTCTNNDTATPINLTGATVKLKWKSLTNALIVRNMAIVNAVAGTADYKFAVGEIYAPKMKFEVEITDVASNIISNLVLIELIVRREFT